ncbi:MAG TPA: DUF488 domain-containing protein [Nocardioidaceae bacterium]|nr:DUF488 domain-containing protein [Nocardioidaceae bacterium]
MPDAPDRPGLVTLGHGTLDRDALGSLLTTAGIGLLVDVRRFPGSRNNPAVSRDALPGWLPEVGIDYRWEERLGGRRTLPGDAEDLDTWWQVAAFRAYAGYTRTPEFTAALDDLLAEVAGRTNGRVAVMCSESVWWRCHRRIIADVAVLGHHVEVRHLMHDGRLNEHNPSAGARRRPGGTLVWDGS